MLSVTSFHPRPKRSVFVFHGVWQIRHANRQSSQRFSEVVSNGPTAIPAKEDVDAALSSVLSTDDLAAFRQRRLAQQHGEHQVHTNTIRRSLFFSHL